MINEMPQGCSEQQCAINNEGHVTLHRLYSCPRFNESLTRLRRELNESARIDEPSVRLKLLISLVTELSMRNNSTDEINITM